MNGPLITNFVMSGPFIASGQGQMTSRAKMLEVALT